MIYIVEDDSSIRELEQYALQSNGYETTGCEDAASFWAALRSGRPDLVILDVMLPDEDGYQILAKLRADPACAATPVIMVTAKTSEIDVVKGLDHGADDYLCKPFGIMEFISRVRAVLRRAAAAVPAPAASTLRFGDIVLDDVSRTVRVGGVPVELTFKEYALLHLFLEHPEEVLARERIMKDVWDTDDLLESRTIDMHVRTLRQKRLDLLLEIRRITLDRREVFACQIPYLSEGSNAVGIAAAFCALQTNFHDGRIAGATASDKGEIHEIIERAQACGRQGELQRKILAAAQQIDLPHIFAGFSAAVCRTAELVERAGRTDTARLTVALLAIEGLAEWRHVVVVLAALWPVGVGEMVIEKHADELALIIGVIRIIVADLKLQIPAAGDLDPLHGQLQAVHIVGKILARKVAVQRRGKHKILIRINCVVILKTHKNSPFQIKLSAVMRQSS